MAEGNANDELIEQLKVLIKKLENPKKDMSAWVGLAISFLSTVVIAGLSLYFSNLESERSNEYNLKQIEVQKANLRVEELKALNSLIPALSSKDTAVKRIAFQMLEASQSASPSETAIKKTDSLFKKPDTTTPVIAEFYRLLKIAESRSQPIEARTAALEKIGKVTFSSKLPITERNKVIKVATTIASSPSEPESIKKTATAILENIKNISLSQLESTLKSESVSRVIDGIIIHHTGTPFSTEKYNGLSSVMNIAKFQVTQFSWNKVSWHYLIAPDGSIWLGVPLNEGAIHTPGQNKTTVSVLLFMDGDVELPTEAQLLTLKKTVGLLSDKLKLGTQSVHTHHYFNTNKTCPGKMVTEQYIQEQLSTSD
ncbi:hypothetical protein GR160_07880 [Flavobacterium sp. Sd200]|uniref:peptidoglycan recognition protein family protein n=1 Tax=Flavobacterium sp. Sd200 TaxID=2692211 RepID=UPI001367D34D|nr:peptidoglycan recognition family protein [Flavobacterium sp. Sd200]MXN91148.1 hypothetical protein [Flavobacterium sp. Sd200]